MTLYGDVMYKIKNKMNDRRKCKINYTTVTFEPFEVKESITPIRDEIVGIFEYVEDDRVDIDETKVTMTDTTVDVQVTKKTKKRGN